MAHRVPPLPGTTPGGSGVLSVAELNHRVRSRLEADPALRALQVSGEISNFYRSGAGHVYFTLKDEAAAVRCVMWSSRAATLGKEVTNGLAVVVEGDVSLYESRGDYQLTVHSLQPAGEGLLWLRLAELKKRLEAEGLFDPARKRALPRIPLRVGVVTSRDGAAFQDILNVLRRRAPYLEVVLANSRVQGRDAAPSLVAALERIERSEVDVVIIGRGGGSLEDLWAFNEEPVVRAVARCRVPIVSAVGHETDWALTDFAADLRAPTPSAAAEKVAPAMTELHQNLDHMEARMARRVADRLEIARHRLEALARHPTLGRPALVFSAQRDRVARLADRLPRVLEKRIEAMSQRLHVYDDSLPRLMRENLAQGDRETKRLIGMLDALSPLKVLGRGYSIATSAGRAVRSVTEVAPGDDLTLRVADGEIVSTVKTARRKPE